MTTSTPNARVPAKPRRCAGGCGAVLGLGRLAGIPVRLADEGGLFTRWLCVPCAAASGMFKAKKANP